MQMDTVQRIRPAALLPAGEDGALCMHPHDWCGAAQAEQGDGPDVQAKADGPAD